MSMEENEPQSNQGQQPPPSLPASAEAFPAATQNAQQQRRRRRRRKTGRVAVVALPEAQPAATPSPLIEVAELARQQSREPNPDRAAARAAERNPDRAQARDHDRSPDRDQSRDQVRDTRQTAAPDAGRPRQGGQQQSKKQQRQARSGSAPASNNGSPGGSPSQGRQFQKSTQPAREHNPGNGSPAGPAGARRKNKVRRTAPTFVGPMDHSYRVVNGNVADGSPSTMDFRSNTSNGNGNVHGRNGYSDAEVTAPALLREDAPVRIICFIEDLFVVAKMQETARKLGVKVSFAKAEKESLAKLMETPEAERPSLIVFDLNNANAKPLTLIPKLKAKLKRSTSIIGFLSHIQGDLKLKAIEAGCDTVMPKAAFSQNLPNLLRRHGLDEEPETADF